jgi:hypothetical protein
MTISHVHSGYYLLDRTVVSPCAIVGATTVIEDIAGDVEDLNIYNFEGTLGGDFRQWLCEGRILIVKEPWYKIGSSNGQPCIRVESTLNLVFVSESDEETLRGTNWYKKPKPVTSPPKQAQPTPRSKKPKPTASRELLKVLDQTVARSPQNAMIQFDRCKKLMELELYFEAKESLLKIMESDDNKVDRSELLSKLSECEYQLRNFENAKQFLSDARVEARLRESETGQYDMMSLVKQCDDIDAADYMGPIAVDGSRVIVMKPVPRGTLLLAVKAFATSEKEVPILREVIQAAEKNPASLHELYSLLEDVEAIEGIDQTRIERICVMKAISFGPGVLEEGNSITGLWIFPSHIRHSCLENTNRLIVGDFMMLFAASDLNEGDEITRRYCELESLSVRTKQLDRC